MKTIRTYILLLLPCIVLAQQVPFTNSLQFSGIGSNGKLQVMLPDFTPYSKSYHSIFKEYKAVNNAFYNGGSYFYPYSDKTLSLDNPLYQQESIYASGLGLNPDYDAAMVIPAIIIGLLGEEYSEFARKRTFTYSPKKSNIK